MKFLKFSAYSLKARITLGTLLVVLAGSWLLTFHVSRMLTRDMEQLLSEQQFSLTSLLAAELDRDLQSRRENLQSVALAAEDAMRGGARSMQRFIDERPLVQTLFNGGVVALQPDGTVIAEYAEGVVRRGINYRDYPAVHAALVEGKPQVGAPMLGKHSHQPVVWLTVPIRGFDGQVIGALAGIINLGLPSSLSRIMASKYGKTGGFVLIDAASRTVITATDKRRTLEHLPAPGISPVIDRFLSGHAGSAVFVNPLGVEILASDVSLASTGWVFAAVMPTREAFAPIGDLVSRMLLSTAVLTLIVGAVIWWLLARQLAPLGDNLRRMAAMADPARPLEDLPVQRDDEIGRLAMGFNRLVDAVNVREEALRESDEKLHSILSTSHDGYWEVDSSGRLVAVNRRYAELSGYGEAELIGMPIAEIDAIHTPEIVSQRMQRILQNGSDLFETTHRRKDGSLWEAEVSATFSAAGGGRFVSFVRDISARKQDERQLQAAERRFRALVEQSLVGVYFVEDGRFIYVNQRFAEMFGHADPGEFIAQRSPGDIVAPQDRERVAENLRKRLSGEVKSIRYQVTGVRRDGSFFDLEAFGSSSVLESRPVVIGVALDVTERVAADKLLKDYQETLEATVLERTRELAAARDAAEAASRAKSAFLARMSHELRTPLNHIAGFTMLLDKSVVEPKARERLANITTASRTLLRLIDDILDYSRVESDELQLHEADFVLTALVEQARLCHVPVAREKGLELVFDLAPDAPNRMRGDAARIAQVLGHLIDNAIKFSEQGRIVVRVKVEAASGEQRMLRFEVEDQGIGIPEEQKAELFEVFSQGDGSSTRRFGGTGLSLALCRRLLELMAGKIGFASIVGRGSTFWFSFPLFEAASAAASTDLPAEAPLVLLQHLLALLDSGDFDAVRFWHQEQAALQGLLGDRSAHVESALADIDFEKAREIIETGGIGRR